MKVLSNGMTEIFRAYTRQLRNEYVKAGRESAIKQSSAKGYEKVEISKEALALAASRGKEDAEDVEEEKGERKEGKEAPSVGTDEDRGRVEKNPSKDDT